jgi:hypothetical protein
MSEEDRDSKNLDKMNSEMNERNYFSEGMSFGIIVSFGILFLVLRFTDNHADYWRDAFCVEAHNPPEFCKEVLGYRFQLIHPQDGTD